MKINNNYHIYQLNDNKRQKEEFVIPQKKETPSYKSIGLASRYNDHLLSFKGRVDKGLERFYETNKDRMPVTMRRYVEALEDKTRLTPLEAQRRAFAKLETAETIEEVKEAFPDDGFFDNLINPTESKAKRGIISSIKENAELLALSDQGVLKNKENLTIYLTKKVFLEGKTIDEINKDLENDLDEDFKADFKFKNKNKEKETPYVYGSTLKALGIKVPDFEYQQSLRYTREGYSDFVGDKISAGQIAFWNSLSIEERTSRAKKSVQSMENWWNGLSKNEKLDMLADKVTELEMLKMYKKAKRAEEKETSKTQSEKNDAQTEKQEKKHTRVGSKTFSEDELFKKWASTNLRIYEESLSEADKDTLHVKRMQRLVQRWAQMSPAERTDYISKMKAGSEPLRYTMIDAWNHSQDLIKDLSQHLKANQIYKPADLLYSTQEFSEFQSQVMKEFWEKHPEHANNLGNKIIASQQKIQMAISRGTFEELKKEIMRDKNQRVKEIEKFKATQRITPQDEIKEEADYKKEFRAAYNAHTYGKLKSAPKNYYSDMYDVVLEKLPENIVRAWTKNLKGEEINPEDRAIVEKILATEIPEIAIINRSLEAAMADTIYQCTKDPNAYLLSNSDVKTVLYHIERGDSPITIQSHKTGKVYTFNLQKSKVDAHRINSLYEEYKKQITDNQIEAIIHYHFENMDDQSKEKLKEYISQYGNSATIIFSERSSYPKEVKEKFYEKFKANMPTELKESTTCFFDKQGFDFEAKLKHLSYLRNQKFKFIPSKYLEVYNYAANSILRKSNNSNLETIEKAYEKRKTAKDNGKLLVFPKQDMLTATKLYSLAMEQALADVLYEATGEKKVYAMPFEELCDNIELFNLVKKYPSEPRFYKMATTQEEVAITLKKRLDISKINKYFEQYINDIVNEWQKDAIESPDDATENLLYTLNPQTNEPVIDIETAKRMSLYGLHIDQFRINPNDKF